MAGKSPRDASHYLQAARTQLKTARDGLTDAVNNPDRKERGLRTAIEFGRSVGETLRHLKSRVHDYESWWAAMKDKYLSNPICGYLYEKRNALFHEGTLETSVESHIHSLVALENGVLLDGEYLEASPSASSFVIGERATGLDGWVIGPGGENTHGRITHPIQPKITKTYYLFDDAPAEFRYRPATDSIAYWLDRLEDVVKHAEENFGGQ